MFTRGLFGLISLIILVYTVLLFPKIESDLILLFRVILYGAILIAVVSVVLAGMVAREKFLTIQAQRKKAQLESSLVISNGETWVQEHIFKTDERGKKELTIEYARLGGIRHRVNSHDHNPTASEILYAHTMLSAGQSKQLLPGPYQENTTIENVPELMTILKDAQRVLIKAISNGGKTTLLQHIADSRIKSESVLVLDSQSYPDKWPNKCKVIGAGSNHQAISIALDNLIELMVKRYQEIGQGLVKEGQHPKLTIIIDEWMAIVDECPNAGDVVRRLLTESRKAAFSVFIGSHSERVKSLGLDGRGDLRDGFLIVRLEIENGQHKATYDYGRGERPCLLPGNYVPVGKDDSTLEFLELKEPDAITQLSTEESRISEMLANGDSRSAIARELFGSAGGNQLAKVDKIIAKINS